MAWRQEDMGGGCQDDPGESPCGHELRMRSGWAERYLAELRGGWLEAVSKGSAVWGRC